ncbi:UNVERIFIED_CONTAM: putative ion channel SYM8 [Sesamum indicum]
MQATNAHSVAGQTPGKPERPPLNKKSRTTDSGGDDAQTPHFPAARRLSPSASFNSTSSTTSTTTNASSSAPTTTGGGLSSSSSDAFSFNFSDRDYVFPSNLGPYSTRRSVTVKSSSSFSKSQQQKQKPQSQLPVRSTSMPPSLSSAGGGGGSTADSARGIGSPVSKPKLRAEKDLKALSLQASASASSALVRTSSVVSEPRDSANSCSVQKTFSFRNSCKAFWLKFFCFVSVSYAIFLRNKVTRLQEEHTNLRRFCSYGNTIGSNSIEVLELENGRSFLYLSKTDPRAIALYTVLVTLITPFLLYKYVDYLPRIKNLSKRMKDSKEEVPLKKRIAYMVDVCFSVYPYAKLLALLFATLFLIGFGGLALYAVSDGSFTEALWLSWTFVADSGNHADRVGTGPRIVSVSISSGGMLIFAMMLGLVSDAISEKVDSLRKGKSEVIESNHILILGWSDKLGSLLKQLAIANKSIGGGVIVVLAERDKEEMEMDIAKLEFDLMGTSVICRSGSPLILADLKKVSVSKARAIIVLASDENADQSDARALRVVLSLTGVKEGLRGHVVVEMSDLDNEPLVKLVGGELIETVVAHDVIGRLMIQCALQPGLAQIWEDILGFENAEFYIKRWPELDGLRFEDVLVSFPDAIPCGVKVFADGGKIKINPDDNYILREGDEILVIAEDDDTYAPGPLPKIRKGLCPKIIDPPKFPEKILFCGWRRDIDDMIMVLEAFLAPGSELWMFNEVPEKDREKKLTDGGLDISGLVNLKLVHREGNAVIRRHLESLPLETFDSILILADESVEDSIVHSDSRSLATLLLIRDIQSKRLPYKDTKSLPLRHSGFSQSSWIREMQQASDKSIIISEILDSRTRNLVSVTRISDYVLSNELVSMALAMVAEDKQINRVLEELFAEEGNELCIKPAEFYLYDQEELCFYDIMIRGRQRKEIVIGYRLATAERAVINPVSKSTPRKWSIDDVFVVISSGE